MADAQQSWLDNLSSAIPSVGQILTDSAKAYDAVYGPHAAPVPTSPAAPPAPASPTIAAIPTAPAGPSIVTTPIPQTVSTGSQGQVSSWLPWIVVGGLVIYLAAKG